MISYYRYGINPTYKRKELKSEINFSDTALNIIAVISLIMLASVYLF